MAVALPTTQTVDRPDAAGYGGRLGSLLIRLAVAPDRNLTPHAESDVPDLIQTAQNPEDFSTRTGRTFSRSDFSGGEGLEFAHRSSADADRAGKRFWDSRNIDILVGDDATPAGISLLHDTSKAVTDTATNLYAVTLSDGAVLYASGSSVVKVTSLFGTPSTASEDPFAAGTQTLEGLCLLDGETYAAGGTDTISKRSTAGVWAVLASSVASYGVWATKGRVFTDSGAGKLETIDLTSGAPTTVLTLGANTTINDVIDAGSVILVAASDGYLYSLHDSSGTLSLVSQSRLTSADIPVALGYASGVLLVGSYESRPGGGTIGRLYRARIDDVNSDYTVADAQLVRSWDTADTIDRTPRGFVATRDSIYFAVIEDATETHLWRYILASSGLVRHLICAGSGDPYSLGVVEGQLYATVNGVGIFAEQATYPAEGWLMTPAADFFNAASKLWIGVTVSYSGTDPRAGPHVAAYISHDLAALSDPDHASWGIAANLIDDANSDTENPLSGSAGRWGIIKLVLTSNTDGGSSTALVRAVAGRTLLGESDVTIDIPVNVSDRIEHRLSRPVRAKGWGRRIYSELLAMRGSSVVLELYRPAITLQGSITEIALPVQEIAEIGSVGSYALVRFRGREIASQGAPLTLSSESVLGYGTLGIIKLGGAT